VKENACKECKKLTELDVCEICSCRSKTTPNWIGFFAISDPETSQIAKQMGIKLKGKYALKVR
jgi:DNA-directed RNA polymerase subunit E"